MRSAAAIVAEAGADLIDINMGCPVRKVCKTGAGAALLGDPELAVAIARAARRGRRRAGHGQAALGADARATARASSSPCGSSRRRGSAAIGFHPALGGRPAQGQPDYALARELVDRHRRPGDHLRRARHGRRRPARLRGVRRRRGDDRPRLARQPLDLRGADRRVEREPPSREEVVAELLWVIDRAEEHLGPERAARYLRKFYPWYLERLGRRQGWRRHAAAQATTSSRARRLVSELAEPAAARPESGWR